MAIVDTEMGLRRTRESARRDRFEPVAPFTSINVQSAILEGYSLAQAFSQPPATIVTTAMSPYTPVTADRILLVDSTAGPITITLPLAATRTTDLIIKDDKGQAVANNISVNRTAPDTIDGLTTYLIDSKYSSTTFAPQTGGYYVKD